ncbi:hypothetical protein ACB094_11G135100 [Castanea mollissima]
MIGVGFAGERVSYVMTLVWTAVAWQASFCRGRRSQSNHNLNVLSIETSAKASFNIKISFPHLVQEHSPPSLKNQNS